MANYQRLPSVHLKVFVLYLLLLIGVGVLSYKKPSYNWDMLPYTAVMLQYNHQPGNIHDQVYQMAARQLPAENYAALAGPSNANRKKWAENADAFNEKLPVYVIKPLYTLSAWQFYKWGVPIFKATVIPSVIAYLVTGIVLFIWLAKYFGALATLLTSALIMLLPPIMEAAKLSTPDFLSGMFIFLAIYFLTEKASVNLFYFCFILAILARIDFLLPLLILLTAITFLTKTISLKKYVALTGIAIITYLIISCNASSYGWSILYFPSFFRTLNPHHDVQSAFNLHEYIELLKAQVMTALYYSHSVWLLLISVFSFLGYKGIKTNLEGSIILSLLVALASRFVLQPVIADRFYIGYYLIFLTLLAIRLSRVSGTATAST